MTKQDEIKRALVARGIDASSADIIAALLADSISEVYASEMDRVARLREQRARLHEQVVRLRSEVARLREIRARLSAEIERLAARAPAQPPRRPSVPMPRRALGVWIAWAFVVAVLLIAVALRAAR